jgi:hypothetical protein
MDLKLFPSVILLQGSASEMGEQYGKKMAIKMLDTLHIIIPFFLAKGISYQQLIDKAEELYQRYSFQEFIISMAKGSGISLTECKMLLAMETFPSLLGDAPISGCSFVAHPISQGTLIARFYDYPEPFNLCAQYLTVTILQEDNKIPVALISMAGQIYGATCVNAHGMFISLNNGMPSGGYYVEANCETILIKLLKIAQESNNIEQAKAKLRLIESDFSLIINVAAKKEIASFEFSSTLGLKELQLEGAKNFVATNFFQHSNWKDLPIVSDETCWLGVSRYNNLCNEVSERTLELEQFIAVMSKTFEEGGAKTINTIYQAIYDTTHHTLYISICGVSSEWFKLPLNNVMPNSVFENLS